MGQHRFDLLPEDRALALLRPLRLADGVVIAIHRAAADLRNDEGLVTPTADDDLPALLVNGVLHRALVVPPGVDVDAHHVAVAEHLAAGPIQQCRRHGAGCIQLVQQTVGLAVAVRTVVGFIRALIEAAPDEDGRMIVVLGRHFAGAQEILRHEVGVAHAGFLDAAGMGFLPDQQSHLVAQIQEARVVGIMAGTHRIAVHVLHQQNIVGHGLHRDGAAEGAVLLVAVEALDRQLLAVEEDVLACDLHRAEAEAIPQVVHRFAVGLNDRGHIVQHGRIDLPRLHIGAVDHLGDDGFSAGGDLHRDERLLLRRLQAHVAGQGRIGQVRHDGLHPGLPALRRADGRDVQLPDIHVAQVLDVHWAGDAAVGIIIVGEVQRAFLAEAVVHLDPQDMLAIGEILRNGVKGGVRAVMLRQQRAVQIHLGPEAHAPEDKAHIAPCEHGLLIHRAAAVIVQRGDHLPRTGDEGFHRRHVPVKDGQRPQGRGGISFADQMGRKQALHGNLPFMNEIGTFIIAQAAAIGNSPSQCMPK